MSRIGYLAVGASIGLISVAGGRFGTGVLIGAVIALVFYELRMLTRRVSQLERDRVATSETDVATSTQDVEPIAGHLSEEPATSVPDAKDTPPITTDTAELQPQGYRRLPGRTPETSHPELAAKAQPNPVIETIKNWFGTGNVPVKVGVIVSFFGVAFLLKYAVEQNLLNVPMWLRLVFAGLFGLVLLIVGWRLRHRMRVYGLSLQGGGVGIIYLTIFAAFRLYGLLPPVAAFVLLALITVPVASLAVMQNARAMAVLAISGGFLAPILTSTGQGSHVALFSYYLLLNIAIVGIAWFKSWRELNLTGFLFTFIIGTTWGYKYYRPELLGSTEPFLIAHFLLYQVAALLFAFRQPPRLRGIVDGTLIFGTPIVAFGLQAALLADTEHGLAYSAVVLGLFYGVIAWWLSARGKSMGLLRDSYLALAIAFATVAVPLLFDASWTAATWAMEGAALIWISVRQAKLLPRFAGVALIVLAGAAFFISGSGKDNGLAILNSYVLSGVLISLAGFFSARNLERVEHRLAKLVSLCLFAWGIGWWILAGWIEIENQLRYALEYPVRVGFLAASAIALSFFGRRMVWRKATFGSLLMLPLLAIFVFERSISGGHPFESHAALSWLLAAIAHFYILYHIPTRSWQASVWHVAGVLFTAWLFAWEIEWWVVVDTWSNTAISLMLTLVAVICLWGKLFLTWPLKTERSAYVISAGILLGLNLLFIASFSLDSPGDPLPFSYWPVLNPYDLTTIAALLVSFFWVSITPEVAGYGHRLQAALRWLLAGAVFVLSTIAIVRGVYHFTDLSWRQYALSHSVVVQAALSIYWGLLGFGAMVVGAQRNWRWLWLTGSALMALVVLKLFVIDLGNSGTVARIVSFIGVGALLLVVGYFAPVPPSHTGVAKNEG